MADYPEVAPQGYTQGQKWGQAHYASCTRYWTTGCQRVLSRPLLLCLSEPATALALLGFLTSQTAAIDNSCPTGLGGGFAEHLALRGAAQEMLDPFALSKGGGQLGGTSLTYPMGLLERTRDVGYTKV